MKIYRAMTPDDDGLPKVDRSARQLGVRTLDWLPHNDVGVALPDEIVSPGEGMSAAPHEPAHLPRNRRPPQLLGGAGKDPVWELDTALYLNSSKTSPPMVLSVRKCQLLCMNWSKRWPGLEPIGFECSVDRKEMNMAFAVERVKLAWASGEAMALHREVEQLAADGHSRQELEGALEELLRELRSAGVDEDSEEIVNGVWDRLTGWCHSSQHITTAAPSDSTTSNGSANDLNLAKGQRSPRAIAVH